MGTFGTGPFDNDGALDLLDELASQPAYQRREVLERIFFRVRDRPDLLGWKFFPDEVVAAAAAVAASLPGGEGIRQDTGTPAGLQPQRVARLAQSGHAPRLHRALPSSALGSV
jgi:Domain of unknown function (DUF4259)